MHFAIRRKARGCFTAVSRLGYRFASLTGVDGLEPDASSGSGMVKIPSSPKPPTGRLRDVRVYAVCCVWSRRLEPRDCVPDLSLDDSLAPDWTTVMKMHRSTEKIYLHESYQPFCLSTNPWSNSTACTSKISQSLCCYTKTNVKRCKLHRAARSEDGLPRTLSHSSLQQSAHSLAARKVQDQKIGWTSFCTARWNVFWIGWWNIIQFERGEMFLADYSK